MATWAEVTAAAPELAAEVERRFAAHVHKTMATLRADGGPRISGTELVVAGGELWLGSMPGSRKAADLARDPRVAVHSGSDDPPAWTGDAKVSGRAVRTTDPADFRTALGDGPHDPGTALLFRLDLAEVSTVVLHPEGDRLVLTSWTRERGVQVVERR